MAVTEETGNGHVRTLFLLGAAATLILIGLGVWYCLRPGPTPEAVAAQLALYPKDYPLPRSVLTEDWSRARGEVPPCLRRRGRHCDVFPAELTGAPPDQLIFVWGAPGHYRNAVLEQDAKGHWSVIGSLPNPVCPGVVAAMRAGQYAVVAPEPPRYRDIEAGDVHMRVEVHSSQPECPK